MAKVLKPVGAETKAKTKTLKKVERSDDSTGRVGLFFLQGLNKEIYNLSGWNFVEDALEMTGLVDEGDITGPIKDFFGLEAEPKTTAEKVAQQSGAGTAFGIASTIGTGGVAAITSKAPMFAKTSEKVVASIMDAWRSSPTTVALWETITAGTSEAGRAAAEEGGAGPSGQAAAALAGGVAPVVVAKGGQYTTYGLMRKIYTRLMDKDPMANARAAKIVKEALDTGIGDQDQLAKSNQVFRDLDTDWRPGIAEGSGSPQLLRKQLQIESEAVGSELDQLVLRKAKGYQAVRESGEAMVPTGDVDPSAIPGAAKRSMAEASRDIEVQTDEILMARRLLAEETLPKGNRIDIGETLRTRRDALRRSVGNEFSERAEDIGLNQDGGELNASDFLEGVTKRFFKSKSRFANKEKAPILKEIRALAGDEDADGLLSFEDVKALRTRLNDDISDLKQSGKRAQARELVETKKMLDDWFSSTEPPPNVDPEQWALFRDDYSNQFIKRFEQGTAFKVGRQTKQGDYQTGDEAVADLFLQNERTAGDFHRLYADADGNLDPEAATAMRGAIMDKARKAAVVDGTVNEPKLRNFVNRNEKTLDIFPAEKAMLGYTRAATANLSRRQAVVSARQQKIERSVLKSLISKSETPDEFIDNAIKSPAAMRAAVRASERAGLGRRPLQSLVWERVLENVPPGEFPSPKMLGGFIEKNKKSLQALYDDKHLKRLENMYEALGIIGRTPVPGGQPLETGTIGQAEQYLGTGIAQASSRVFAIQSGRTGKYYPMIDGTVRFLDRMTKRRAHALAAEALFNQDIAKDIDHILLTAKIPKPIERRLNAYLFNMGFGGLGDSIIPEAEK